MSNTLLNYLNKRLKNEHLHKIESGIPGPIITISREVGCNGVKFAGLLASELNQKKVFPEWKVLSKEIFYQSAKELDVEPERVRNIFKQEYSYALNDILNAFGTRRFKSEQKITRTVKDVIKTFANEGFYIIVGRAAHIIAYDIKNALHIRFIAPLEYRIKTIIDSKKLNLEEAIDFINRVEKERQAFRKAIGYSGIEDDLFDLFINRASFNDQETIDLILRAIYHKAILRDFANHTII